MVINMGIWKVREGWECSGGNPVKFLCRVSSSTTLLQTEATVSRCLGQYTYGCRDSNCLLTRSIAVLRTVSAATSESAACVWTVDNENTAATCTCRMTVF
ncbi:hypothetical protein TNCV_1116691 [Trichonephila clavipes]|nr:hypothetical protein TNCV_1116691 [Trichonephila clavipes]